RVHKDALCSDVWAQHLADEGRLGASRGDRGKVHNVPRRRLNASERAFRLSLPSPIFSATGVSTVDAGLPGAGLPSVVAGGEFGAGASVDERLPRGRGMKLSMQD